MRKIRSKIFLLANPSWIHSRYRFRSEGEAPASSISTYISSKCGSNNSLVTTATTTMSVEEAEKAIPAVVRMFSGCEDKQTSADVSNVSSFRLPDPKGRAGGALTSALLNVTYADHSDTGKDLTFKETLFAVREKLNAKGFEQIPQLSSSRPTDMDEKFSILPADFSGTRRAVMIGINYVGDNPGELRGCHNDVHNMQEYIKDCHGFQDEDIVLLLDDDEHTRPTSANILAAFKKLASEAQPGDACFVHYSGHGCSIRDDDGDEADRKDEALCPVDYQQAGVLRDDDVLEVLIAPLPKGVSMTCVMDCCHSGTILDLPFIFLADGEQQEMMADPDFDFGPLMQMVNSFASAGFEGLKDLHETLKNRRKKRRNFLKKRLGF